MSREDIKGSGSGYYQHMDAAAYRDKINTPARNREYFERFHKPMVRRAKQRFGVPVRLIDIACGPADELKFFENDRDVQLLATDISPAILTGHTRKNLSGDSMAFAMDVGRSAIKDQSVEAGVLVNALVYVPDKMLSAMFNALKGGGECAANVRLFDNPHNAAFYDYYVQRGGRLSDADLAVKGGTSPFRMKALDYTECINDDGTPDEKIRALGQQVYFKSIGEVEGLIRLIGFEISEHSKFNFVSPVNPDNQVDVFILKKPENQG